MAPTGSGKTLAAVLASLDRLMFDPARIETGEPYLIFGDGRLNACKPIGDEDLATFLVDCLADPTRRQILTRLRDGSSTIGALAAHLGW